MVLCLFEVFIFSTSFLCFLKARSGISLQSDLRSEHWGDSGDHTTLFILVARLSQKIRNFCVLYRFPPKFWVAKVFSLLSSPGLYFLHLNR